MARPALAKLMSKRSGSAGGARVPAHVQRAASEVLEVFEYKLVSRLIEDGFFKDIEGLSPSEAAQKFADRNLFFTLLETLKTLGYVDVRRGFGFMDGRIRQVHDLPPAPMATTPEAIELETLFDELTASLSEALREGKRKLHVASPENKALLAKLYDSQVFKTLLTLEVKSLGISEVPPHGVVVSVGPGIGAELPIVLLETDAKVVSVLPSEEDSRIAELTLSGLGLMSDQVSLVVGQPERLNQLLTSLKIGPVDAVVAVHALHWSSAPEAVLRNAAKVSRRVLISQPVEHEATWPLSIMSYLMGSNPLPKADEVEFWINSAGLEGRSLMKDPVYLTQLSSRGASRGPMRLGAELRPP